jgi:hypothetical protein
MVLSRVVVDDVRMNALPGSEAKHNLLETRELLDVNQGFALHVPNAP